MTSDIAKTTCFAVAALWATCCPAMAMIVKLKVPDCPESQAVGVNATDTIAGNCVSQNAAYVWTPDGTYTLFSVPGAVATVAAGINDNGQIAGTYSTGQNQFGFVRQPDGTIVTVSVPGSTQTNVSGLNSQGDVTGTYAINHTDKPKGFVMTAGGQFTEFTISGTVMTIPTAINAGDAVTGYSITKRQVRHGFLRAPDGTITELVPPGAGEAGTTPSRIADGGEIVGTFGDINGVTHGFALGTGGTYTQIDVPGAAGTSAASVNANGDIVGSYADQANVSRAFLRNAAGTYFLLTRYHHEFQHFPSQGFDVNSSDVMVGQVYHFGFIRTPRQDAAKVSALPPSTGRFLR